MILLHFCISICIHHSSNYMYIIKSRKTKFIVDCKLFLFIVLDIYVLCNINNVILSLQWFNRLITAQGRILPSYDFI